MTRASGGNDRITSIAITTDTLCAAGYGPYPGNFGVVARYTLGEGVVLPVSLLDFTGTLQNKSILLKWKIATQSNLTNFVVERSADGKTFLPVSSLPVSGANAVNYAVTDPRPRPGINFYRLKLVDADNKFSYSNVIAIKLNDGNKLQIFPNPAQKILFAEANGSNENAIVQIVDFNGRLLKETKVFLNGQTSFSIDISTLPGGVYNLILQKKEKTETQRFIKQ